MKNKICLAPFTNLKIWPDGTTGACCRYNNKDYKINEQNFKDAFNDEHFKRLREEHLSGNYSEICVECMGEEVYAQNTFTTYNNPSRNHNLELVSEDKVEYEVKYLELGTSNECNLACRMCDGYSSTTFNKIIENKNLKMAPYMDYNRTISELANHIEELETLQLIGGEPFVDEVNLYLIILWGELKPNNNLIITTNGQHSFHIKGHDCMPYLKNLKSLEVNFSLDSLPEINERQRVFCNTQRIIDNIRQLRDEIPHVVINLITTVTIYTVEYITEYCDYILEEVGGLVDWNYASMVGSQMAYHPRNLSEEKKNMIINKIDDYIKNNTFESGFEQSLKVLLMETRIALSKDMGSVNAKYINECNIKVFEKYTGVIELE